MGAKPPARVQVVLARNAPIAAVFRRGPSRWTLISKWRTDTDIVEDGDWFSGSFHTELCDLSPSGEHLLYFAGFADDSRFDFGHQGWTGISKLPYLAPMVRWPRDDFWSGGGAFVDERSVTVWVTPDDNQPAEPPGAEDRWRVTRAMRRPWREDSIYGARLTRDGWQREQECVFGDHFETLVPEVRRKSGQKGELVMTRSLALDVVPTFVLEASEGTIPIDGASWADWDQRGRLVYVAGGAIFEASVLGDELTSTLIHDFNDRAAPSIRKMR